MDRDQQVAFYLMRESEHRASQADSLRGHTDYGDVLADFEAGVADRMYELAEALSESRVLIAPKGHTFGEGD